MRVLEGKTVLITGAARGMGMRMSVAAATQGARVAMVDVDDEELRAASVEVEAAGGQGAVKALPCDVTDAARVRATVEAVVATFGSVDVLVNDAAVGPNRIPGFMVSHTSFWDLDDDVWNTMLRVNVFGPQLMAKTCAPIMLERRWGRIINITTSFNTMYRVGAGAYGPTKAALEAHTRVMASDLDGSGVTANILLPGGPVDTRLIPGDAPFTRSSLIQPDVMNEAFVWLASDDSSESNGMRFIGALWDESLPRDERIAQAGAPAAWTQLPTKAIYPE